MNGKTNLLSARHIMMAVIVTAGISGVPLFAAERFFMYNLTASTPFTGVFLTPSGTNTWGANQALNDKDKAIDPSERLPINGVAHGTYDLKLVDAKGRTCLVRGIDLRKETTFEIRDRDLTDCH